MLKYRVAVLNIFHLKILAEVKKKALKKRRTLQSSALQSGASEEGRGRSIGCPISLEANATSRVRRYLRLHKSATISNDIFLALKWGDLNGGAHC